MTKKFWCHYIGSDGNTPKRRNIELTNLADILPAIDNTHCKTPLWFEKETDQYNQTYYTLYAQLSDNVAVHIPRAGISDRNLETMRSTDADIEATSKMWLDKFFAEYPNMSEERKEREREHRAYQCENDKKSRDRQLATIANMQDFDNYLLSGVWVNASMIRAYEEVKSPILSGLKELRAMALEEREAKRREREEQDRLHREEEARKKAEEEAREQERLTEEADKAPSNY